LSAAKTSVPIPESEQNQPEDMTQGWKPWGENGLMRWWMGNQWSDSYRSAHD
jgi:hypothetical protein